MRQAKTDGRARYLIAAVSGRALAQSAARAGIAVHVLDLFADTDTREFGASTTALPHGLDDTGLIDAANALDPAHDLPVVYGGGFEGSPHWLRALSERRTLCGNAPEVLDVLRDHRGVTETLDALGIPQPASSSIPPDDARGWLIKRAGSCGGVHVRAASTGPALDNEYYQRKLQGITLSVTLLADGESAQVVGYAEQWPDAVGITGRDDGARGAFMFGGAVGLQAHTLPRSLRVEIEAAASRLSAALGLRGLNSLDVILNDTSWALVDINARPGFCFELHEAACAPGQSLFKRHCLAVNGQLPARQSPTKAKHRAHAVVYATRGVKLSGAPIEWPTWTTDRPHGAQRIGPGEPICTVHAAAPNPAGARRAVMARHSDISSRFASLEQTSEHTSTHYAPLDKAGASTA